MRYETMVRLYPRVDGHFQKVWDMIRAGGSVEMAMYAVQRYIDRDVPPIHRQEVAEKLLQWAQVVDHNKKHRAQDLAQPDLCPCCGSLESTGHGCRWCVRGASDNKQSIYA